MEATRRLKEIAAAAAEAERGATKLATGVDRVGKASGPTSRQVKQLGTEIGQAARQMATTSDVAGTLASSLPGRRCLLWRAGR